VRQAGLRLFLGLFWSVDAFKAATERRRDDDSGGVICLLLHNPFRTRSEALSREGYPGEEMTLEGLQRCLAYYRRRGCQFIGLEQVDDALKAGGQPSVLVTFDDGYFNCVQALSVLEKYSAPAIFFITTRPVLERRKFWWDAVYCGEYARGGNNQTALHQVEALKQLGPAQLHDEICARYGREAFDVGSDGFRPMTPDELRRLAAHPLASIGIHCRDHLPLDLSSPEEIEQQILGCREDLKQLTGVEPATLAYPYGRHSPAVLDILRRHGIRYAFGCQPGINSRAQLEHLELRRFNPQGWWSPAVQCAAYCSHRPVTPGALRVLSRVLQLGKPAR